MTIKECIDIVDNVKPNQYSIEDKVEWLSYLDGTIINDVLKTHEGYDGRYDDFVGYSPDKLSVPLVVPSPYDRLYTAYLKMKIDEENGETARYNNSATMFNTYLLEYKKHYNKTHMPLNIHARNERPAPNHNKLGVTEAQYESLKRDLAYELLEYFSNSVGHDKIYDAIVEYMAIHRDEFYGKDGADGKNGQDGYTPRKGIDYFDGKNGKSAYEYAMDGGYTGTEADFMLKMAETTIEASAKIGEVTLWAERWVGNGSLYSQMTYIEGVTPNSKVDLTPSVEQLAVFYEKDLTLVTENDGSVVTVYAIGQKPENDYTIQVMITEVQNG